MALQDFIAKEWLSLLEKRLADAGGLLSFDDFYKEVKQHLYGQSSKQVLGKVNDDNLKNYIVQLTRQHYDTVIFTETDYEDQISAIVNPKREDEIKRVLGQSKNWVPFKYIDKPKPKGKEADDTPDMASRSKI